MANSGVFPVLNNKFKIGTKGKTSVDGDMATIADMETFSISIDGTVNDWTPMELEGWIRHLKTGMGITISLKGKRNVGDKGNDYIAGLAFKIGADAETKFEWEMFDGTKITMDVVVNVKNIGGGESTDVAGLEFDVLSNGKPTVTTSEAA